MTHPMGSSYAFRRPNFGLENCDCLILMVDDIYSVVKKEFQISEENSLFSCSRIEWVRDSDLFLPSIFLVILQWPLHGQYVEKTSRITFELFKNSALSNWLSQSFRYRSVYEKKQVFKNSSVATKLSGFPGVRFSPPCFLHFIKKEASFI